MSAHLSSLPMMFREALSLAGMQAIDEWWTHLGDAARSDALRLWNDCRETENGLSVRVDARFVDDRDEATGFWHSDYYDYLVNHEIYLFDVPGVHICTRQPSAAAAVRAGFIPHDFSCPAASSDCPMRQLLLLSSGKSVRLSVSVHAKGDCPMD